MNEDRLRQILREGDPAAQDAGLTPDEIHTLRRTVLNAIPESRRRFGGLPLLAAGTAVLILLALVLAFDPRHRQAMVPPPAPRMATVTNPAPAPPAQEVVATPQGAAKSPEPRHRHPPRLPQMPPAPRDTPVTVASLEVREIRFSTPGGTRIIWELAANDAR
jgi:hypothetical protein